MKTFQASLLLCNKLTKASRLSAILAVVTLVHNTNQLSILVPYSALTYAFITTFLTLLVVGILAVQKFIALKKQFTKLEEVS